MFSTIKFSDFNKNNPYKKFFVELGNETYIFTLRWNEYANCAFLSITDYNDNPIISGRALTNRLVIRNNDLPYILYFSQIDEKTYEANLDNFSKEFAIVYDDGTETEGA